MAEQVVTPYTVSTKNGAVDYDRLVSEFGCCRISEDLIRRVEKLTKRPAHPFLRRGVFFAHRDLEIILDAYEKGRKFYLYTGRGPSSESLHLGHLLQFMFTKYLQDAFDVPVVVQLSTDEKFIWKDISMDECNRLCRENTKDILACGFNIDRTFIFSNLDYISGFAENMIAVADLLTFTDLSAVFGFKEDDSTGKFLYPAVQIAPAFSTSFPDLFPEGMMRCLIPCAIDQDPYFRLSRDVSARLKFYKPALVESRFLPPIQEADSSGKMSASAPKTAVFVSDTLQMIKEKVDGCASVETLFMYLTTFMDDDLQLDAIKKGFGAGEVSLQKLREELSRVLWELVEQHQLAKEQITDEVLSKSMTPRKVV